MLQVEFFFDFSCPWSYLACARLREAAMRTGAEITWRPFSLAELDAELADRAGRLSGDPARSRWQLADLEAWAHYCDLPLALPEDWPQAAPLALCGALHAADAGRAGVFVPRVFRAIYGAGMNGNDAGALREQALASGLDGSAFEAALADAGCRERLIANAAELKSRGGFRSATLYVGEQMYCGNSRMPLVEFALAQASGRQFVMPGQHN